MNLLSKVLYYISYRVRHGHAMGITGKARAREGQGPPKIFKKLLIFLVNSMLLFTCPGILFFGLFILGPPKLYFLALSLMVRIRILNIKSELSNTIQHDILSSWKYPCIRFPSPNLSDLLACGLCMHNGGLILQD